MEQHGLKSKVRGAFFFVAGLALYKCMLNGYIRL
jgi:hypothetical protein